MKDLSPNLEAHLASNATTLARCWRISRLDGVVLGFTDHDADLLFDGTTFSALDGLASTGDVAKTGFGVGGLEIAGALSSTGLDAQDLSAGRYDGASVEFFLVNWADVADHVLLRRGTLGEVTRADDGFRAEIRGPMQQLETVRGRVFSRTCDADLGDRRCGVDVAPYTRTVTVIDGTGPQVRVSGLEGFESGWFAGGAATVLTGAEAGARLSIAAHTAGVATAVLTFRPEVCRFVDGDTIAVVAGCDKSFGTCGRKFANALNFRGFPHLPGNDKVLGYARRGS